MQPTAIAKTVSSMIIFFFILRPFVFVREKGDRAIPFYCPPFYITSGNCKNINLQLNMLYSKNALSPQSGFIPDKLDHTKALSA